MEIEIELEWKRKRDKIGNGDRLEINRTPTRNVNRKKQVNMKTLSSNCNKFKPIKVITKQMRHRKYLKKHRNGEEFKKLRRRSSREDIYIEQLTTRYNP